MTDDESDSPRTGDREHSRVQRLSNKGNRRQSAGWNDGPQIRMQVVAGDMARLERRRRDWMLGRFLVVVCCGAVPVAMRPAVSCFSTECGEAAQDEEQGGQRSHAQASHAD